MFIKVGGAGRHTKALMIEDPVKIINWQKLSKATEMIYFPAMTFPKLAILALYMRIFTAHRRYRIAVYTTGTVMVLWSVAGIITCLAYCKPFAYAWNKTIPGGKCGDTMTAYRFISIPNIVTDIVILVLPLPAIYKLHISPGAKLGLLLTLAFGSL